MDGVWTITEARGKVIEQDRARTTAGERVMALDRTTAAILSEHRRGQHEQRRLVGPAWADEVGRVFTNAVGGHLVPGTILARLHRIAEDAGLPRVGVHGLRHSYATAALRAGVDIAERAAAAILGE